VTRVGFEAGFRRAGFFRDVFFRAAFFGADFFAVFFFAAFFFVAFFFVAFLRAVFFLAAFFGADFFAVFFDPARFAPLFFAAFFFDAARLRAGFFTTFFFTTFFFLPAIVSIPPGAQDDAYQAAREGVAPSLSPVILFAIPSKSGKEGSSKMTDDIEGPDRQGVELPFDALSPEALRNLVEEFVTRDGTDYGAIERSVEQKIAQVMQQIRAGEARLTFDPETETANIVVAEKGA
jgi:uncharacterized protein YheU (UPF0270 family)